jgi:hypothetical protein
MQYMYIRMDNVSDSARARRDKEPAEKNTNAMAARKFEIVAKIEKGRGMI